MECGATRRCSVRAGIVWSLQDDGPEHFVQCILPTYTLHKQNGNPFPNSLEKQLRLSKMPEFLRGAGSGTKRTLALRRERPFTTAF